MSLSASYFSSLRVQWMVNTIEDCLGVKANHIEEALQNQDRNKELFEEFLLGEGPSKIFIYYQVQEQVQNDDIKDTGQNEPSLFITYGDKERLKDKAIFFFRNTATQAPDGKKKPIRLDESSDHEVVCGEISSNTIPHLNHMMEYVYSPFIDNLKADDWGQTEEDAQKEFLAHTNKFAEEVHEAIGLMSPGQELFKLDPEQMSRFNTSANEGEKIAYFEQKFTEWIKTITTLLVEDQDQKKERERPDADGPGPHTELEYWRTRMQKITNWNEQLKSKDFQHVKVSLQRHKQHEGTSKRGGEETIAKCLIDYTKLDLQLTDRLNEAKDNVKYLTTLEKFIEPLYKGNPQQIIDTLPALMNAIKMIHTIARFYNTADKMTSLFMKITNQMIRNCKERIMNGKKIDDLWKRDPAELIEILGSCIKLYREYKSSYTETKDKVADMPKGKTFDFSETSIFGKFEAFVRRLQKLIDIFSNIQQFRALAKHNLEDMDKLTNKFDGIIESFKKNRHELLDTSVNKFDRDWVEFNVEISKLDVELQNFIDNNFTRFRNIEYSLKLLRKFETTIKRDSLKHNLQAKYNAILHNYATELDSIQRAFQDSKINPPIVRNMPPEAGKIIWSRHLFQKITGPINLFPENVINSMEIKKYYGSYNTLGKQLTIYEMWYYQNWVNEIERSKAALQATLIVRHEENKKLYVNFDLEIMQLIREAKCLDRQAIEIPESARIILLQEEKFKMYYNELLYALKEHERIISKIKPICKVLLAPHVEDLELKLRPGMVTLTWTSMNIDSYLFHVHQGLKKLEQLIINVNDIIENRIENNLKNVSKIVLVSLPQETKPLTLDTFVQMQNEYIESKKELLMSKNVEVERAVDDLLQTILLYPLDPHVDPVVPEETKKIKRYYFFYFYQALLNSTQNSLNAMKYRVCGKKTTGSNQLQNLKPFFEVDIQLEQQDVKLHPSLDMIQSSINKAATAVLRCSRALYNWEQNKDSDKKATFYDMIACDKEIVKVILLLTGSIQGTKNKVNEFLDIFKKYDWLCKDNITENTKKFQARNPALQEYEDQLKKFTQYEEEIDSVDEAFKIGAMQLLTKNIKESLKVYAREWKKEYSETLHKKARIKLDDLTEKTKSLTSRLQKDVNVSDALGDVMKTLEEIRTEQAQIEMTFTPVHDMYQLLDNYLQGGISDKDEMDARSMYNRNWDQLIILASHKSKELQIKQREHLKDLKHHIKDFVKDVQHFRKQYEQKGPMVEGISPDDAMERLRSFKEEYQVKNRFYQIYKNGEELFGLQKQSYPELEKTEAEINNLDKLYNLYDTVIKSMNSFKEKSWQEVTKDELLKIEEDSTKYGDQCLRLPRDLKEWAAYKKLKSQIEELKEVMPLIIDLKKPSIRDRHWIRICEISGKTLNYENPDQLLIEDLLQAKLLDFQEDVIDIIESAEKQLKIQGALEEIQEFWNTAEFKFATWGKRDQPCMLSGLTVGEIIERLDEDQMTLSTLNANRHVTPFKADVENKIKVFSDVNETLDQWISVQKLWSSLEPVFTGGDIAKQMPLQAKNFQGIDKNWMKIMEKSVETKKVIPCCQNDMLKDFLPDLLKKLEECQKSLEQYLEKKRKSFPRFYFVSNPTLLSILSQGSNPMSVQEDLEKLFDAINEATFEKNMEKKGSNELLITAITQKLGMDSETIQLRYQVKCEGNIEDWLKTLEVNMQKSLLDIGRSAAAACLNTDLRTFCRQEPSQIALMGLQILWTVKIQDGLEKLQNKAEKGTMEGKRKEVEIMMQTLTAMCLEDITSSVERTKTETLVTIMVHQKDITMELKCKDVNDFEWQKQTRMLWNQEADNCMISITDWDAFYSYEFLGAKERLCITPLTDRCYITLAQAMSMYYGGAPAGPAGTGKTETVKDMGRTLGVFVVVTNCSDQHRYKDMAKIFKGLVQSGLWGCFDEFNRIDLEVLSVVAMQVEAITTARKQKLTMFQFPEEENLIELVESVSYFITMNPGYAGRQELPENLKVLFRGVTMMVPDREIIIKVKLASVGYTAIDLLAKKFNVLYKLCEEQLSKQRHYDFGLRNILSVLRTAGNTKRKEPKSDEEMLMMRALRDMNLSKLVADDIPLFNGLLLDIFPKQTNVPKMVYPAIEKQIPLTIATSKYSFALSSDSYALKIIQVYENSMVRHGYMLVGPSATGKTSIMNILTDSLTALQQPHRIIKLNPKAITAEQMYGVKSEISDDWIPGVFSTIWEKSNKRSNKQTTWITCDGPVDAIWIENLNTVLDDNKILTLANGERIAMTENCKMVFEVENLNNASPATVSRCGQVYISSTDMGYELIIKGWLKNRKIQYSRNDECEKLEKILTKYFITMRIIENVQKLMKEPVMITSPAQKVITALNLITGLLSGVVANNRNLDEKQLERFILYTLAWSIGGLYEAADRAIFYDYLWSKQCELPTKNKESDSIFDYYVSPDHFDWKLCNPDEWKPSGNIQFSQILMPTIDSFRAKKLLDFILLQEKSVQCNNAVLLLGVSGSAKTSSVLMYAQEFDKQKTLFKRINFSSATSPQMFQEIIETECDYKFTQRDFGPPNGKCLNIFIDDMSMPFVNKWGDQITLEMVRQLIEQGGFYMLDKTMRGSFKNIKNLVYIGAMNQPGAGRNDIPNRLKKQFLIFNMILPLSIDSIYNPIIKHIFKEKYFNADTNKIIDTLTSATIGLWNKVKSSMLPTPQKFHYVFNMRELSRIFKGILGVKKEVITTSSTMGLSVCKPEVFLVGLWRHESERVFSDKMINNGDKNQVRGYINDMCAEHFSQLESEINDKFSADKFFEFCDFLREDVKNEDGIVEIEAEKIYEGINSREVLRTRCYTLLNDYNAKYVSKRMPLVLFDDALRHLMRISRCIQQFRSSALLVGVGGSGKQSLTRLAAEIGKQWCHQITVTKSFGDKDLKEEIKRLFTSAGHQGKPTTFLMTDAEVKKEDFLEFINMILSTGEIPGLLAKDEKEVIYADIRNDYVKSKNLGNIDPTTNELWNYFVERTRDNLHVVLCFSPVGQKFRDRARKFPALFNECTIDWFLPWPEEALVSVAETFIKNFKKLETTEATKQALMQHMGNVHIMVNNVCDLYFQKMRRAVFVTPKSFLSYLNSYKDLYIEKFEGLDKQESSFKVGLAKIKEAQVSIAHMEVGLKEEEQQLKEATDKTEKLMANLAIEQRKANQKADEVELTTKQCQEQADMIQSQREAAEKDLQAAMPALDRAQRAVSELKSSDIVEMKSNRNPLDLIKYIMDSVVVFFQGKLIPIQMEEKIFNKKEGKAIPIMKDSWEEVGGGRSTLNDMTFMQKLVSFEKDQINDETIELLEPYIRQADWFNEEMARKASVAAAGILRWALAINEYHEKSKIVKPKKIFLAIQEGRLAVAKKELAKAQEDLKQIQEYLAELKEKFTIQQEAKNSLEAKAAKTKKKINTARQLIYSLTGEKERWDKGALDIGEQKRRLVGNSSLATAFISYCGPFNAEYRHLLAFEYFTNDMKAKSVPVTPGLDLVSFLVDEATIGEWNLQGLPKDDLSIQNGIMVTNSTRYPLFIDPQSQGSTWIKNKFAEFIHPTKSITTLTHPKFKDNFLKFCMEEGKCLIIENIENEVDPMLDPVLEKQVILKGKTKLIDVGGTQFEFSADFRMFMTCRLSNPAFSPELSAKTTIIDFTVTQKGLEQQLLGKVISKEQKALEDSLNALLAEVNQNKKDLQKLDANLLHRLTTSTGNLLDDHELMEVLNSTKTRSKEVEASLIDAEIKSKEINEKREQYRPVAIRGSALYFTMIEVSNVNWMYNSSLEQFLNLFMYSIANSEKAQLPSKRVDNIIDFLTFEVYRYVNRGLFERDKITFILMMCFKILQTAMKVTGADVSIFLKAGAALDIKTERTNPFTSFLSDKVWLNIIQLSKHNFGPGKEGLAFFRELPDSFSRNEQAWRTWIDRNDPENFPVPDFYERMVAEKESGAFMTLCLVRSLREDRTLVAANQFIGTTLGKAFTAPISYPIEQIQGESTCYDPVLFLLTAGADPTSSIDELAKKKKKFPTEKVSMGEGQERVAKKAIEAKALDGGWVILQNCHLGLKFMEEIETLIVPEGSPLGVIHEEFRLWITCEAHPQFPLGLLQKTIKVTNEPPQGLKAGLYKTFTTIITQEFVDKVDHPNWRPLIFTVCFLHSVVIERKKFGPLGWCIPYEYNYSDLEASLLFVEKHLTQLMSIPGVTGPNLPIQMSVIRYMVSEVQYGGRITDDLDRELFIAYGDDYLKEGIFGNEHVFTEISLDSGGGTKEKFKYKIPANPQIEVQKYVDYVNTVPSNDSPEVFGLHSNADLTFRLKESLFMIDTIMETRPKDSSVGGGKTREEIVQDKARELLIKLPVDYVDLEVREQVKKLAGPRQLNDKGLNVPLNIFLYQELQRMQRVIGIVRKTFTDVIESIDGTIIMTPDILDAINAIFDAKVPSMWLYDPSGAEISWLLPTLGSWFASLIKRNQQLNDWLKTAQRPQAYWLTGFFNPQGFLTGMKQEVTRMHKKPEKGQEAWSLDDVIYKTEVKEKDLESIRENYTEGVLIRDLFLEGCKWSKTGLDESDNKKMFAPLPILYVTATTKKGKGNDAERLNNTYSCPVYKYPRRTDKYLIFRVNLPCEGSQPQRWKLRGVALLCSTE